MDSGLIGLLHFIRACRVRLPDNSAAVRIVYRSELVRAGNAYDLDAYIADRAPLFYRDVEAILRDLRAGLFLSAVKDTLAKLPTSHSFQESHFGEIVAGIFAEEAMGLRKLYSKLSLLTTQNANANKMDLVLYDRHTDPIEFVFAEVKSSPKRAAGTLSVEHDKSCFADLFRSMNAYTNSDREFDLTAARDQISKLPEEDRKAVSEALMPYSSSPTRYAGFAIIDTSTFDQEEAKVLQTRTNKKTFDVDLVCIEAFSGVASAVYQRLQDIANDV